jgi:hypothetical protein
MIGLIVIAIAILALLAAVTDGFTDTISVTYSGNGKAVTSKIGTYLGTKDAGVSIVVPAGATNLEIDVAFPINPLLQALVIDSSVPLVVKTNSSSAPGDTINLKGNMPVLWGTDYVAACPLSIAVTKLFVTNAGAVDSKFDLRALFN